MMVSVREYFVRRGQDELVISTRGDTPWEVQITKVATGPWIDIEDHRAWHVPEIGQQVAYAILLYHLSLGRDGKEANLAATYWRGKFFFHVLRACIHDHVALTDVFINAWLVERMLDEVKNSWGLLSKMRSCCLSDN